MVGAPWRCGVLTKLGGTTAIGLGHLLGGEHDSTPQSGVQAPRLSKRSLRILDIIINMIVIVKVMVIVIVILIVVVVVEWFIILEECLLLEELTSKRKICSLIFVGNVCVCFFHVQ